MKTHPRTDPASTAAAKTEPHGDIASIAEAFIAAQRAPWAAFLEVFLAWQGSLIAFNGDLWEQWAVRYAGGLPIDS